MCHVGCFIICYFYTICRKIFKYMLSSDKQTTSSAEILWPNICDSTFVISHCSRFPAILVIVLCDIHSSMEHSAIVLSCKANRVWHVRIWYKKNFHSFLNFSQMHIGHSLHSSWNVYAYMYTDLYLTYLYYCCHRHLFVGPAFIFCNINNHCKKFNMLSYTRAEWKY